MKNIFQSAISGEMRKSKKYEGHNCHSAARWRSLTALWLLFASILEIGQNNVNWEERQSIISTFLWRGNACNINWFDFRAEVTQPSSFSFENRSLIFYLAEPNASHNHSGFIPHYSALYHTDLGRRKWGTLVLSWGIGLTKFSEAKT